MPSPSFWEVLVCNKPAQLFQMQRSFAASNGFSNLALILVLKQMSGAMSSVFLTCLLYIFIPAGFSLECWSCETTGRNCQGQRQTCPIDYEECGVLQLERSFGQNKQTTVKNCTQSNNCDKELAVFNMGKRRTILGKISCCTADDCKSINPLRPRKITVNGFRCPSCYSVHGVCVEESMECSGDEYYCAQLFQTPSTGGNTVTVIKGCANKAYCDQMEKFASAAKMRLLETSHCVLASRAVSIIPELFGLFLSSHAGLLFVTGLP
ncbi:phospholipase A2 inhibitor gamma subunit B-like isoform X1 [Podarcis raffonei]|uniref:phospholipase A2 inhibitor gamma subunit B-like isoform X1 n=1 Tax=Podarcis raffonei TaxID=65483 RepID=UPI0023291061|nr:phospholipase A2 inhibitor gamma subunit B-like isoform X1 [Podarcis raffonei]